MKRAHNTKENMVDHARTVAIEQLLEGDIEGLAVTQFLLKNTDENGVPIEAWLQGSDEEE